MTVVQKSARSLLTRGYCELDQNVIIFTFRRPSFLADFKSVQTASEEEDRIAYWVLIDQLMAYERPPTGLHDQTSMKTVVFLANVFTISNFWRCMVIQSSCQDLLIIKRPYRHRSFNKFGFLGEIRNVQCSITSDTYDVRHSLTDWAVVVLILITTMPSPGGDTHSYSYEIFGMPGPPCKSMRAWSWRSLLSEAI